MDLATLKAFEAEVRKFIPGFEVRYKTDSWVQRLIGFLTFPFNPQYMTKYTTTVSPYVYFPSKDQYEANPKQSFTVLAHELVHLLDSKAHPIWMRLSYVLPQAFGLAPLLAYACLSGAHVWTLAIVLVGYLLACLVARKSVGLFWCIVLGSIVASSVFAVLLTGWVSSFLFTGLACFAPWPSPWRTKWELRGYTMNLAILCWSFGSVPDIVKHSVLRHFVTADYYYMSWDSENVYRDLVEAVRLAQNGELRKSEPFATVHAFMSQHGLRRTDGQALP